MNDSEIKAEIKRGAEKATAYLNSTSSCQVCLGNGRVGDIKPREVIIQLEGGVIQDIKGIPEGVIIRVRDYDVEGCEPDKLSTDGDGDECIESIWSAREVM